MKRGFVCFLVLGVASVSLANTAYDNAVSETKEISSKISASLLDKSKRGAVKITNTDNAGFNHLGSNTATSSISSSSGFKPSSTVPANPPPFKYLYSNQYYQPYQANPYLTYVQIPQAAQIAAQYAFQANPVTHYLQTPTQIQYVSAPTVAQVSPVKYQTFSNDYSNANAVSQSASTGATTSTSSYVTPSHPQSLASQSQSYVSSAASPSHSYVSSAASPSQSYVSSGASPSQSFVSSAVSATQASSSAATTATQSKQVQVPLYNNYQTAQPFYYPQQQFFTYVPQTHVSPSNFIYQQPNANYFLKQQQLLNFYGGHRFGFYNPAQTGQLTYLVPMAVAPAVQDSTTTTTDLKTSDKTLSSNQNSASSSSFTYGTKA